MSASLKSVATSSARGRVTKEEWETRVDLAAAYQLAAMFRWTDLIYTHFSARVPGTEHILINAYGLMFDEITASNLVKIDLKGNVLEDSTGMGYNEAGFVIHGCVHEARPEVNCVIHTHTRAGVAVRTAAAQPARAARARAGHLPRLRRHRARHGRAHAHGARSRADVQGHDPAQPRAADRRRDGA
jgi:ribulose-5-phosphate 4-epimerase/fuculose-1-phosphate aldolase